MSERNDHKEMEPLLHFLRQHRGFDFTGYKRPSLTRRVQRRMQMVNLKNFDDYTDYLEVHPEEFAQLFNTILINVTSFFRDPPAWDYLAKEIVPRILKNTQKGEFVRVWSAGCASGEEAYTAAIVLAEALGVEAFQRRVKIYATDVDQEALATARHATYTAKDLEALDDKLKKKYFEPLNGRFCFRADLRRSIIFGCHDLIQDAPISRLDLLISRNTIMYFNAEAQARILARFHFALNKDGYLFLGKAELLLTHANLFTPMDLKFRVFTKVAQPNERELLLTQAHSTDGDAARRLLVRPDRLAELAIEDSPIARIAVDANGNLALANQKARVLFKLNPKDIGRPLKDLEISYRPADLRSLIDQAYAEHRTVTQSSIERRSGGEEAQYLDIIVTPLYGDANDAAGIAVSFTDITPYRKLQDEIQHSRQDLQTSNEELQSSNEELETTNEELQSSNEELETSNEELQSTNEELETMNEEMQSSNAELQTLNDELRQRTEELGNSNAFLKSVLAGLHAGAVVVNREFNILVWNRRAEELWGLREQEVQGRSLLNLDIGLPANGLKSVIRPCLSGETDYQEMVLDATNRRGKAIKCRVTCTPLDLRQETPAADSKDRQGVILLMEEWKK